MNRGLQLKKTNTNGFSRRRRAARASSNHQPSQYIKTKVQLPPETTYLVNIRAAHRFFHLTNQDALVLADCDGIGKLTRQYCLLEKLTFTSATEQKVLLVCSCAGGKEQHDRLAVTSSEISENIDGFIKCEQALYCIHARTALKLASEEFDPNSVPECDEESSVDLLSTSPFLAVAYNSSYGLISRQTVGSTIKFRCNRCTNARCAHITTFLEWCTTQGLTEEIIPQLLDAEDDESYPSVSYHSIPYPLSEQLRSKHDSFHSS